MKTVLTSLPAAEYSIKAVAELYQERQEVELRFRGPAASAQHHPTRGELGGSSLRPRALGNTLQTCLPLHRRTADRDSCGATGIGYREAAVPTTAWGCQPFPGTPPPADNAEDGEHFQDPLSGRSQGCAT